MAPKKKPTQTAARGRRMTIGNNQTVATRNRTTAVIKPLRRLSKATARRKLTPRALPTSGPVPSVAPPVMVTAQRKLTPRALPTSGPVPCVAPPVMVTAQIKLTPRALPTSGPVPSVVPLVMRTARVPRPTPPPPPPSENTLQPLPAPGEVSASIIDDEVALQIFRELGIRTDDHFLNSGKVLAWALQPDDPAFINIHDYVDRGQLHGFGIKILSILRIIPKADSLEGTRPVPLDFSDDPNAEGQLRMMLWHGTKRQNLRAILENGLKLPASHGQMFGSGIYFADRVSKSCQYCDNAYVSGGEAYLFLCDVLLGTVYKAFHAMATLTGPPAVPEGTVQYTSVKGCGINVPDYQWDQYIDGCIWPLGPTTSNKDLTREGMLASLRFNEYIVYDTDRVQPKYMVKVQFTRNLVHELLY